MAGEEDVLRRCTSEQKAATLEDSSTESTTPVVCTTQHESPTAGERRSTELPQSEGGIKEAVPEPQAEDPDGYEDEAKDDYEDDAEEYDDEEAEDDYDYDSDYEEEEAQFEEQRHKVTAALLSFPEAASLKPDELDAAVERVLEQSKSEYADVAAPGKIRLLKGDIEPVYDNWFYKYDDELSLEELDKEFLPLCGKSDEDWVREREQFRAKVRKELIEKGYVEVDEDYYEKKDEYERQVMQKIEE